MKDIKRSQETLMDLLYIGAILAFGGISCAMLMGLDKLRRTSKDRGTH
jgi:hypothetical protein